MSSVEISKLSTVELAKQSLVKPDYFGYWGNDDMFITWGFVGIDRTRDSNILEISNFEVITKDLMEKYPDDFRIENYGHWLSGWVDRLCCRVLKNKGEINQENITEAFRAAMEWHKKLSDYPVASENDYSEREYEAAIEFIQDLPNSILDLVDPSIDGWAEKIFHELVHNMDIDFIPDGYSYPTDDDFITAIYNMQLWDINSAEQWNEWTDRNGLERIPVKQENPNQLKLFEE